MADLANEGRRALAVRSGAGRGPGAAAVLARAWPCDPFSEARSGAGSPSEAPPPRGLSVPRPLWGERPDKGSARPGRRTPRRLRSALRAQLRGGRPRGRGWQRAGTAPAGASRWAGGAAAPGAAAAGGSVLPRSLRAESLPKAGPAAPAEQATRRLSRGSPEPFVSLRVQLLFGVIVCNFRIVMNLSVIPAHVNPSSS